MHFGRPGSQALLSLTRLMYANKRLFAAGRLNRADSAYYLLIRGWRFNYRFEMLLENSGSFTPQLSQDAHLQLPERAHLRPPYMFERSLPSSTWTWNMLQSKRHRRSRLQTLPNRRRLYYTMLPDGLDMLLQQPLHRNRPSNRERNTPNRHVDARRLHETHMGQHCLRELLSW
jgi:hypothetical protein